MLEVKLSCKNPYDQDHNLYTNDKLKLEKGSTILVGRNGVGKSTLLYEIEQFCKKNKIPVYKYDNYHEGGSNAISSYGFYHDFEAIAMTAFHSEGEQIYYNFGRVVEKIGKFVREHKEEPFVILLDALESGLDVEGIEQIKEMFSMVEKDAKEPYIVCTANNYGLVHKMRCMNARTFEYLPAFEKYEDFKEFIDEQYRKDRRRGRK